MQNHLLHRIELTYRTYLLRSSKYLNIDSLVDFDAFLHDKCRMLYSNAGAFMLERWYKYPFVSAWRKNHKKDFMFAMNVLLARILRKVHSAIKHVRLGR
jgi:hypothetical protein